MCLLLILFFIILILGIIFSILVAYTAHNEYLQRKQLPEHKPKGYRKKKEIISELPLISPHALDNIKLSLVFPAYNEEKRISPVIKDTIEYFNKKNISYEIIIVNDGSKDNTLNLLYKEEEKYPSIPFTIVTYTKNGGKGYAVKSGMTFARGEYILMLDSDGATQISGFEGLYKKIENKKMGIAIGSRAVDKEKVERNFFRNFMAFVNNIFVKVLIGVGNIKDTQCGFKLFTRDAARHIFFNIHLARWAFDIEMLYIAFRSNIPVFEVPVVWKEVGGSKLVLVTATLSFFRDYIAIILFYNFRFWKINKNYEKKEN